MKAARGMAACGALSEKELTNLAKARRPLANCLAEQERIPKLNYNRAKAEIEVETKP